MAVERLAVSEIRVHAFKFREVDRPWAGDVVYVVIAVDNKNILACPASNALNFATAALCSRGGRPW